MFGVNSDVLVTKTEDSSHSENLDNLNFYPKDKKLSPEHSIAKTEMNEEFIQEDDYMEDDFAFDSLEGDNKPLTLSIKKRNEKDGAVSKNNIDMNIKKYYDRLEGALDLKSDEEVRKAIKNLEKDTKRGPKPKQKGPLVCEICAKEYKRRAQHMQRNHPELLAEKYCEFCDFSSAYFTSTIELLNHYT